MKIWLELDYTAPPEEKTINDWILRIVNHFELRFQSLEKEFIVFVGLEPSISKFSLVFPEYVVPEENLADFERSLNWIVKPKMLNNKTIAKLGLITEPSIEYELSPMLVEKVSRENHKHSYRSYGIDEDLESLFEKLTPIHVKLQDQDIIVEQDNEDESDGEVGGGEGHSSAQACPE